MSKKSSSRQHIEEIRRILSADGSGDGWPDDLVWARQFLSRQDLSGGDAPPPAVMDNDVISALIDELVERQEMARVADLARLSHKAVAKAARTALHRMRARRVDVDVPTAPAGDRAAGTGQVMDAPPPSFASVYEPGWERHVLLADKDVNRGLNVIWARISARTGLIGLEVFSSMRRKEYRALARRFEELAQMTPVPREDAVWLINDSATLRRELGHSLPAGFGAATTLMGQGPGGGHPALAISPARTTNTRLISLYELAELRRWVPDQLVLHRLVLRLQEVGTSQLILDDNQRQAQVNAVIDRALAEIFDEAGRAAARRALLDTAHLYACSDNEEPARLARAAADLFELPAEELLSHPFTRRFLERLLRLDRLLHPSAGADEAPQAAEEPPRSTGGLILPPGASWREDREDDDEDGQEEEGKGRP